MFMLILLARALSWSTSYMNRSLLVAWRKIESMFVFVLLGGAYIFGFVEEMVVCTGRNILEAGGRPFSFGKFIKGLRVMTLLVSFAVIGSFLCLIKVS